MASLMKVLQSELRSLSSESQKKHPSVKEAADRGVRQLRSLQEKIDQLSSDQVIQLIKSNNDEIVKPFLIACESKNTKLIVTALSSLHQLLQHHAVPEGGLGIIIETVARLHQQTSEETVQLKLLQLVLTIFTASNESGDSYELTHTTLAKLLKLCYSLVTSKSVYVELTAKATIRQATNSVFEKLSKLSNIKTSSNNETNNEEPKNTNDNNQEGDVITIQSNISENNSTKEEKQMDTEHFNSAKNSLLYLKDICLFAQGQSGTWLNISGVDSNFGLELLDSIIGNYGKLFHKYKQFQDIIDNIICPLLLDNVESIKNSTNTNFNIVLRVYKLISSVLHNFTANISLKQILIFLEHFQEVIEKPNYGQWNKYLALKIIKEVFYDCELILFLHVEITKQYGVEIASDSHILCKLASAITSCVQSLLNFNSTSSMNSTSNEIIITPTSPSLNQPPGNSSLSTKTLTILDVSTKQSSTLESLLDKTSYSPTLSELINVCLECTTGLIASLSKMAGIHRLSGTNESEIAEPVENKEVCSYLVNILWAPILATLYALLECCEGEEIIQSILRNYLLFTHTCGVTGSVTPRDAFLTNLCKFTPKIKLPRRLTHTPSNSNEFFYSSNDSATTSVSPLMTSGGTAGGVVSGATELAQVKLDELNRKSILVMKILFNIAHCLGALLGTSWYLLLKNFLVLDKLLTQRLPFTAATETEQEDLNILYSALQNLFVSTCHLSDDALLVMLKALCRLSKDTINNTLLGETSRLFAAQKLIETVQVNIQRIDKIWNVFAPHMLQLVETDDETIRKFAVTSVSDVIISIYRPEYNKFSIRYSTEENTENKQEIPQDLERTVFTIFMDIFQSSSNYGDTREFLLNTLNAIIQKCGDKLSSAWTVVLPLLKECAAVPTKRKSTNNTNINRAKLIPFGFKCVQSIGSEKDYLSTLGFECLTEYFSVVTTYVKQKDASDLNLSLVAISLFMSSAEFLTEKFPKQVNEDSYSNDKEAGENEGDLSRVGELWLTLYEQLKECAIDPRPEVRHSTLRTLTFMIASHGHQLTLKTWTQFVSDVLLKILDIVHEYATTAETNPEDIPEFPTAGQDNEDLSSVNTKKKKQIFVHHSRNTAAKQWSETRSLVIECTSRIVTEHGSTTLCNIPLFTDKACDEITLFIHKSVLSKTSEIAITSVRFLYDMLFSTKGKIKQLLWKGAWEIWHTLVDFSKQMTPDAFDPTRRPFVKEDTVTTLLEGIGKLFDQQQLDPTNEEIKIFTQEDVDKVITYLIDQLITGPAATMGFVVFPSQVQRTCLELISKIVVFSEETRELLFTTLVKHLPSKQSISKGVIDYPPLKFAIHLQKVLIENCCLQAPHSVQKHLFPQIIQTLGDMMLTKFAKPSKNLNQNYFLWRSSVKLFEKVITTCLNSEIEDNLANELSDDIWNDICTAIENFLFFEKDKTNTIGKDEDDSDSESEDDVDDNGETLDESILLTNLISDYILLHTYKASPSVKSRFLLLLERASQLAPKPVAKHSLRSLFGFVSKATQILDQINNEQTSNNKELLEIELGQLVLPILFKRCKSILYSFIEDDKKSGQFPLPKYRRHEVIYTLTELKNIRVHSTLFSELNRQTKSMTTEESALKILNGPRGLIIRLYSVLCECISSCHEDLTMKSLLLEMFLIVGKEMGITESHILIGEETN
ncbi:hypothetical protein ABK040_008088 [Willaertia magna]